MPSTIFDARIIAGLYLLLSARSIPEALGLLRLLSSSAPDHWWVFGILMVPVGLGVLAALWVHQGRKLAVVSALAALWCVLTAWNQMTPLPPASAIDVASVAILLWALAGTGVLISRLLLHAERASELKLDTGGARHKFGGPRCARSDRPNRRDGRRPLRRDDTGSRW